ncbi:MAG: helix-turn-helix domain-containing protein [Alphaproteobacteria bacterium]|jgi:DNA-binding HxlR family transcriptional regulator|uniref:winged helix-turn-helix transcriptional regulator n=1 Tax=Pacificispira sp. TaxID=2888761 RepID=UPI001B1C8AFC|nr:helix-turn-helix transcriptional regulator [Alphaproteobacteria bacterium]MBO6864747.1 helix-turn-helix transcriptional regulator [Alphaproteobacteria bacterium]MEC9268169.1 helix-turn-helix domain-containing protein [Pseudomonadota bacterium]
MTTTAKTDTGCLVHRGANIFGDRWTLLLLRDMMLHGRKTFGEFMEAGEGVSTNILASRLRALEETGIVWRRQDPENRRSFHYGLTEKGLDLAPILLEIIRWSGRHFDMDEARAKLVQRIETDRDGLLAEIRDRALSITAGRS